MCSASMYQYLNSMYRGCSVKVETMVPICWHILYGMKLLPRLSPHNAECNNVYTEDVLLLGLVTCTLVPTKNKSLVLCQPIVLSQVFAPCRARSLFCAAAELGLLCYYNRTGNGTKKCLFDCPAVRIGSEYQSIAGLC